MKVPDFPHREPAQRGRVDTYYDLPAVKASPWHWKVSAYLFTGALAGGAQLLAGLACAFGGRRMAPAVRNARYIAAGGGLAGAALLVADLRTPQRCLNMLRIFRRTSPMSIGTYIVSTFNLLSLVTAYRESRRAEPGAPILAQLPASLVAIGQCTYTAPLLATTSTPLWAAEPELIAVRYGSSAVALAASALSLLERLAGRGESARPLETLALVSTGVAAVTRAAEERRLQRRGVTATDAEARELTTRAALALTTIVPLACGVAGLLTRSRLLPIAGSLAIVAGTLLSKQSDISAGNRSARSAQAYLRFTETEVDT